VDFEQLKIENQQYFERIDGKNKELLQLKLSTGKTVQVRRAAEDDGATRQLQGRPVPQAACEP
jgi:hypothetical protein